MYFDTHIHLDYLSEPALQQTLESNYFLVTVAVNYANQNAFQQFVNDHIWATQGIHPGYAQDLKQALPIIKKNIQKYSSIKAIGEIGLDYHYPEIDKSLQQETFSQQLEMASQYHLPVIIHTREASQDTIAILRHFKLTRVLFHSFTGDPLILQYAQEIDAYLAVNGIVTFKNAQLLQEAVKSINQERLLVETDAPFLAPTPHRSKENKASYLPLIAQQLAYLRGVSCSEIEDLTLKNARTFFAV